LRDGVGDLDFRGLGAPKWSRGEGPVLQEKEANCWWLQGSIEQNAALLILPLSLPLPLLALQQNARFTNNRFGTAKLFLCASAIYWELPSCKAAPHFPAGRAKRPMICLPFEQELNDQHGNRRGGF
jgi:hypothetical protein